MPIRYATDFDLPPSAALSTDAEALRKDIRMMGGTYPRMNVLASVAFNLGTLYFLEDELTEGLRWSVIARHAADSTIELLDEPSKNLSLLQAAIWLNLSTVSRLHQPEESIKALRAAVQSLQTSRLATSQGETWTELAYIELGNRAKHLGHQLGVPEEELSL
ncbi:hypothetical protein [Plantibacter flavus]|uniref:hypothetical protein n=1 Tax=Plantibacter flavus TaxID=150123 RepID=UPI00117D7921|nr:hypothetical protein [Plantibacter flavus]